MDFLTKGERENLIIEYKHYHDENWQRGQAIWVVNSILITGSLIVAFQANSYSFLLLLVSFVLVLAASILHYTSSKVTSITYKRMEEIREQLGLTGPTELYQSKIKSAWWYPIRTNVAYGLFIFLMGVYLFLLLNKLSIL
jgi:hypothetical protein